MRTLATLLLLPLTIACAEDATELQGGQTGEEQPIPCVGDPQPIGWNDVAPSMGMSPADWVDGWPIDGWASALSWANGDSETLSLFVSVYPETAMLVIQQPGSAEFPEEDCADRFQIDATLAWTSDAHVVDLTGIARSEGMSALMNAAPPDPTPFFAAAEAIPADESAPIVDIETYLDIDGTWGVISAFGTAELPDQWVELGSWGDRPE